MGLGKGTGKGGARPGAGRPCGSKSSTGKRRQEEIARLKAAGAELPLDRLLRRMGDLSEPERYRDSLAIAAAPYLHPRLTSIAMAKAPFEMTQEELEQTLRR
jgi:hypothetical protein